MNKQDIRDITNKFLLVGKEITVTDDTLQIQSIDNPVNDITTLKTEQISNIVFDSQLHEATGDKSIMIFTSAGLFRIPVEYKYQVTYWKNKNEMDVYTSSYKNCEKFVNLSIVESGESLQKVDLIDLEPVRLNFIKYVFYYEDGSDDFGYFEGNNEAVDYAINYNINVGNKIVSIWNESNGTIDLK